MIAVKRARAMETSTPSSAVTAFSPRPKTLNRARAVTTGSSTGPCSARPVLPRSRRRAGSGPPRCPAEKSSLRSCACLVMTEVCHRPAPETHQGAPGPASACATAFRRAGRSRAPGGYGPGIVMPLPATPSKPRRPMPLGRIWDRRRPDPAGLVLGTVFFILALTPSLLPRDVLSQGALRAVRGDRLPAGGPAVLELAHLDPRGGRDPVGVQRPEPARVVAAVEAARGDRPEHGGGSGAQRDPPPRGSLAAAGRRPGGRGAEAHRGRPPARQS